MFILKLLGFSLLGFIALTLYCCLRVASDADDAMEREWERRQLEKESSSHENKKPC